MAYFLTEQINIMVLHHLKYSQRPGKKDNLEEGAVMYRRSTRGQWDNFQSKSSYKRGSDLQQFPKKLICILLHL